jgi:hypothetical protein
MPREVQRAVVAVAEDGDSALDRNKNRKEEKPQ